MPMKVHIDRAIIVRSGKAKKPNQDGVFKTWLSIALDDNSELNVNTTTLTAEQAEKLRLQPVSMAGTLQVRSYTNDQGVRQTALEFTELQITQPKAAS